MASMPPAGLRIMELEMGGRRVLVLSHRLENEQAGTPPWAEALSAAERAVVQLLLEGRSYAAIAALRGTALGTVKKQAAAAYRKLGVTCRAELVSRYG